MRTKLVVALALSLGTLAGCSGTGAESTPEVVSLQAPSSAPGTNPKPAAPVIRPDTTSAEVSRMQQPWMKCLKEHGVPMQTTEAGLLDIDATGNSKKTNGRIMAVTDPKVTKPCGMLMPVIAPELDEEKNPYWADDNDNYHECLNENGIPMVKKDGQWRPGPGWGELPPNEPVELACQAKAYDGKKG